MEVTSWRRAAARGLCCCSALVLGVSMAAATTMQSPGQLSKAQESIMRDILSSASTAMASPVTYNWSTSSNPCQWSGVHCSPAASTSTAVCHQALAPDMALQCHVLASICRLDTLQSLNLEELLHRSAGQFSPCPMKAGLQELDLSSNNLSGHIGNFSGFHKLEVIDLPCPNNHGSSLQELVFSGNNSVVTFRWVCSGWKSYSVDLCKNSLAGDVPDNFLSFPKLKILLMSGNSLTGEIPRSLLNVSTLFKFAANQNNLSGSVPQGITKNIRMAHSGSFSQSLYSIRLGGNLLSGSIPESIGNVIGLLHLVLDGNNLAGSIPWQLSKCKKLELIDLSSNQLQGHVPSELGNLEQLVALKLHTNNLSGELVHRRTTFQSYHSVTEALLLGFAWQQAQRCNSIVDQLAEVSDHPRLGNNELTGASPTSIGALLQLELLDLSQNNLSGQVPTSVASMKSLMWLLLSDNHLSGLLPELPKWVFVNVTGNPGLIQGTEDDNTSDNMKGSQDDFRSAEWVTAVLYLASSSSMRWV
ncbi:hypothetical protein GUJ93_ZPchr0011g28638 [Zizania palustris]|uniref:Leucine-rich repeat-containing N-terminal plant-type domain-containing protein n=1 Tax=Zizania palustris TaxID=103762 RepID=A0A8J5WG70_ZIZPA|nr:hypothetical protein GUJ93_ZPchr0011g28638 [Zizania palustris]